MHGRGCPFMLELAFRTYRWWAQSTQQRAETKSMEYQQKTEIRDGMHINWDVPIQMDDGLTLRADIYRPIKEGKYPVILSHGVYGKWLHLEDAYPNQWRPRASVPRSCRVYGRWAL